MHFIDILAPPGGFVLSEIPYTPPKNRRISVFARPLKSRRAYLLLQNRKKLPKKWEGMRFASMVICVHNIGEVEVAEIEVNTGIFMWFMYERNEFTKKILEIMGRHKLSTNLFCHVLFSLHPKSPIAVMYPTFTHVYGGAVEEINLHTNLVKSL